MPTDMDRPQDWDKTRGPADLVLMPEGGAMVWVKRPELLPRGAVRHAGDVYQMAIELAALRLGIDQLIEGHAAARGITTDAMRALVDGAHDELLKHKPECAHMFRPTKGQKGSG